MTMTSGTATELLEDEGRIVGRLSRHPSRGRQTTALVTQILLAMLFVVAGIMKLAAVEFEVNAFGHFGYPLWFMYAIGIVELAGGLMLLIPRLAVIGAMAMMPIMIGAAFSHLSVDPAVIAIPPAIVFALLGWFAYGRRSEIIAR